MAKKPKQKKKKGKPEITLERVYNVPLRKQWLKAPLYKRAKKAVKTLREFLAKHMKTDIEKVKLGKYANLKIWERGIRFPPPNIKVTVKKDDEGTVFAELEGAPVEEKEVKKPKKPEEKPKEEKKIEEKPKEEPKQEEKSEEEKKPEEKPKEEKTVEEKKPEAKPKEEKEEPKPVEEEKPAEEKPKQEPKTEEKK